MSTLYFVVPGDINTRTGGYVYGKKIIENLTRIGLPRSGMARSGWQVILLTLPGDYPFPDAATRQAAQELLATIPEGSQVVVDGLAFSVLPDQISEHQGRLNLIALIHHPLALETGLSTEDAQMLRDLETRALVFARHVITTSPSTANSLGDYAVEPDRISVVCPGTDQADIATGSTTSQLNLLCVATLTARKGHRILIDALAQLQEHDWHLQCAGSGDRDIETSATLKRQCKALKLESRISFLGELGDEQLAACFNKADVFVLASYHEGYGMVLDEAIACALPIVATAGGAIADTIPDGAGLLVPPGDTAALAAALHKIMTNGALTQELRNNATRAREALRSWAMAAAEFENVLIENKNTHV